ADRRLDAPLRLQGRRRLLSRGARPAPGEPPRVSAGRLPVRNPALPRGRGVSPAPGAEEQMRNNALERRLPRPGGPEIFASGPLGFLLRGTWESGGSPT